MTNELIVNEQDRFIAPVVDVQSAVARYKAFKDFVTQVLVEGLDYGVVPGTNKPTLLKPGAEKLSTFFGIRTIFVLQDSVNDWTGKEHNGEPFFFREYKCQGYRNGELIGEGIGSCNSWEKKYRYRWVNEMDLPAGLDVSQCEYRDGSISEFTFAIEKADTSGKYGKPKEYWQQFIDAIANGTAKHVQRKTKKGDSLEAIEIGGKLYAIPNRDVADQVNTIDKMAQKRALVAAVLITTNASDYFTQDMEDLLLDDDTDFVDVKAVDPKQKTEKQQEHKEQKPAKHERTIMTPEQLKYALTRKAELYVDKTVTEAQRKQFLLLLLGFAEKNDDMRHAFCDYVFGNPSHMSMTAGQILAGLDWMNKDAKVAKAEFKAVIEHLSGEIKENGDPVDFDENKEIPY